VTVPRLTWTLPASSTLVGKCVWIIILNFFACESPCRVGVRMVTGVLFGNPCRFLTPWCSRHLLKFLKGVFSPRTCFLPMEMRLQGRTESAALLCTETEGYTSLVCPWQVCCRNWPARNERDKCSVPVLMKSTHTAQAWDCGTSCCLQFCEE